MWEVWTTPEHLHAWYGPTGFTLTTHEFSLFPGGEWRFIMHGPDGTDYRKRTVFREIAPPSQRYGVREGGTQTLDRLADYLSGRA